MLPDVFIILVVALVILGTLYVMRNEEQKNLSDRKRKSGEGNYVKLREGVVRYQAAGVGNKSTVVLVHGFSTYSFTWRCTAQALAKSGFLALRYDLYGRGYSDRPSVKYDKDLFDSQLLELLGALNIEERVDLIGNSMGGLVVTTFAARHPDKVRSLTLIDPAFYYLERVPFPLGIPLIGGYLGRVFVIPSIAHGQTRDFKYPERHAGYNARYRAQMRYKGFARAILSTIRSLPHWRAEADLIEVGRRKTPILLIWGGEDKTTPLSLCDRVRKLIPRAEFHLIEDAAHMPHYERPDAVNPVIIRFLRRN